MPKQIHRSAHLSADGKAGAAGMVSDNRRNSTKKPFTHVSEKRLALGWMTGRVKAREGEWRELFAPSNHGGIVRYPVQLQYGAAAFPEDLRHFIFCTMGCGGSSDRGTSLSAVDVELLEAAKAARWDAKAS